MLAGMNLTQSQELEHTYQIFFKAISKKKDNTMIVKQQNVLMQYMFQV